MLTLCTPTGKNDTLIDECYITDASFVFLKELLKYSI